jgi:hypothetical protein
MPISTDLDRFRLELGDIDATAPLFNDDEAQHFIDNASSILLAVANACDALARRFARQFDFATTSEKRFDLSQKSKAYRAEAEALRARAKLEANGGLGVITTTRADGYSDDLNTRESAGLVGVNGRTRRGYYDGDLP